MLANYILSMYHASVGSERPVGGRPSMSIKYGLLALLAEAPTHGYQLKTAFERRTGGSWELNIGQVYTTLQRLERDGLVETADTGDARNDYKITDAGRTQL